jgi:hypothetical protein
MPITILVNPEIHAWAIRFSPNDFSVRKTLPQCMQFFESDIFLIYILPYIRQKSRQKLLQFFEIVLASMIMAGGFAIKQVHDEVLA